MNIVDARGAYATVLTALRTERERRLAFLKEPLRGIRVSEINTAIAALESLGTVISAAVDAGLLSEDAEASYIDQMPLLDVRGTNYP